MFLELCPLLYISRTLYVTHGNLAFESVGGLHSWQENGARVATCTLKHADGVEKRRKSSTELTLRLDKDAFGRAKPYHCTVGCSPVE